VHHIDCLFDECLRHDPVRSGVHREVERHARGESNGLIAGSTGRRNHLNPIAAGTLLRHESTDLRLDAAGSGGIAVGDVGDVHAWTVRHNAPVPQTLVFVHAHPDDEALLTAGTMAKAVRAGHHVILVIATDGAAGLTSSAFRDGLADIRRAELLESASRLGVHDVHWLGYGDSGLHGENADGFASSDIDEVADRIATIATGADILIGYDPAGGYGHPDHQQVHQAVRRAWRATRAQLFEATLPREIIRWSAHIAAAIHLAPTSFDPEEFDRAWTPSHEITNRVNVRSVMDAKRAALRAHASQAHADGTIRTLGVLSRLPTPLLSPILGTEYYVSIPRNDATSMS
jgi:LmbE family N-acetylglucosaminyl deacetylase